MARTIVLTGFMGTGKTSVGRILAQKLGREFVDLDEWIAAREGLSLAEIFSQKGELYFRACEREAVNEFAPRENLVIATGGGTFVDAANRAAFANALLLCLEASVDQIVLRLEGAEDRPFLNGIDNEKRKAEITGLLERRKEVYAAIATHVPTDGLTIEQVAEKIIQITRYGLPTLLRVKQPNGVYPIYVGHGLLARVGEICRGVMKAFDRAVIVTNPVVGAFYAERVAASLRESNVALSVIEIPDGEASKTLDSARTVYDQLLDAQCDRHTPLCALGGGVIGDLTGFVAATFLRGVPFVQIPTSLLAIVDASIGGKVAVNHPRGKNLIGAFKCPEAVIVDADVLRTLPPGEFRAGMAEVIKHAVIGDGELFERLERGAWRAEWDGMMDLGDLVRAMQIKIRIVEQDPFEENVRAHLNLGHTFAHAIERASALQIRHGEAVAMGIACATRLAWRRALIGERDMRRILELIAQFGLPVRVPNELRTDTLLAAMQTDKKRAGGRLHFILPRAIGRVEIFDDVTRAEIEQATLDCR